MGSRGILDPKGARRVGDGHWSVSQSPPFPVPTHPIWRCLLNWRFGGKMDEEEEEEEEEGDDR